jgi:hypothetical protein
MSMCNRAVHTEVLTYLWIHRNIDRWIDVGIGIRIGIDIDIDPDLVKGSQLAAMVGQTKW